MVRARKAAFLGAFLGVILCGVLVADTFTERWYLAGGGIASGPNAYVDKGPGPDRLPYTGDDEDLPANGNKGGTWSFGFLDTDSDGKDEHAFSLVRRGDDDMFTLTTWSDFAHGIIAEGEMWVDAHHIQNEGPAGADPADDDFEWNDKPNWESESNWFWYNNLRADQRGLGGSIYYFEYLATSAVGAEVFDEVQGWTWTISLNNNAGAGVEGHWGEAVELLVKGLFIPLAAIPELDDGELDKLFDWQDIDMAAYVRDTLYPKLLDPNLAIFFNSESSNGCSAVSSLPPAFVMIAQAEGKVVVSDFFKAEVWGVTTESDVTFRWSSIYIKGDNPSNPPIELEPWDGRLLNLWRQDGFVRRNLGDLGALELGTTACPEHCWSFVDDGTEGCQADYALRLPGASGPESTYFAVPVGFDLDGLKGSIVGRASVALESPDAEGNGLELILCRGSEPVAWVALKSGEKPRLGIGGSELTGTLGRISNPLQEDVAPEPVDLEQEGSGYSQVEILFAPSAKRLELRIGRELTHTFTYTADSQPIVNRLWFYAESEEEEAGVTVDDVSVLQEFSLEIVEGPFFRRGDANRDGAMNIADAVYLLQNLFAQGPPIHCPDAADSNDDESVNIADAVYILQNLFAQGPPIPQPYPACGADETGAPAGGKELRACDYCPEACQTPPQPCPPAR